MGQDQWDRFWSRHSYKSRAYAHKKSSPRVILSPVVATPASRTAPVAKSLSRAGSARFAPLRSLVTKFTVSVQVARNVDYLASEASGLSFRPSLRVL